MMFPLTPMVPKSSLSEPRSERRQASDHADLGGGFLAGVDDADFVIGQVDVVHGGIMSLQGFAERAVEGVDGAVAFGHLMLDPAVDGQFYRCLGHGIIASLDLSTTTR
jgi:hypothetical protein